jgi:hypothetical protein
MTLMDLPKDTTYECGDSTPIIAENNLADWERVIKYLIGLTNEMIAGRLVLCPGVEHRAIVGPQIDGCLRIDIEGLFMYVFPNTPSNSGRKPRQPVKIGGAL